VTIYRALDFLRDAGLVHRLATQNSYVISHGQPDVNAMKIMFVDSKTGETIEVHSTEVAEAVKKAAEQAGFKSVSPFMEVEGEIAQ
jgi:Fur family transcriptional regulator, zinc uptake regulator